ncbi:MAG: M13 family metallopeptidase [Chitinophagaceae bacterium]
MTIKQKNVLLGTALALLAASCSNTPENKTVGTSLPEGVKFIEPSYIDSTVKPGDDFYQFANGTWLKNNAIPASETRWGSFNLLEDFNQKVLHELLDEAAAKKGATKGSPEQMVGDLYACGMDSAAIEKAGLNALASELAAIDNMQNTTDLLNEIARETKNGLNPLWSIYVGPDDKNVSKNVCNVWQGGLGLPDRDYYLKPDSQYAAIFKQYSAHVFNMLKLSGTPDSLAKIQAASILKMETEMAKISMDRVAMRDPYKVYNKFSLADLNKQTPGMDWSAYLQQIDIKGQDTLLVGQPAFLKGMTSMLKTISINDWKAYLRWHMLSNMAPYMAKAFDEEHFNFYGKTLRGQQEQKPRWKRVLNVVDGAVGEQLGKMYTDKYFTEAAKKRMNELVSNLQSAFEARIKTLDWMSAETQTKAIEKLNTFIKKIGYPDKWRDYTGLEISRDNYVANVLASNRFDYNYMINKLGKPVDKTEWGMTPPTVNAYYNPAFNEIVFPAGILQYPFFDMSVDDAAIYGGIGAVIGHEMTHGFDDQGAQYAADGNLKDWWTADDKKRFEAKTGAIKTQYDNYTILNGKNVNGALTLGENIADLGGVTIAYDAFKKTKQGQSKEKIDGFSPDQRFFLSWAQVWRQNIRDEEAAQRLVTDPHSPGEHRCNGPLSNFQPFYDAFNVQPGQKMYKAPEARAKVW